MTTLVAVILNMIGFNTATEINCLVSFVSHLLLVILSDQLYSQGLVHFFSRERFLSCVWAATPNTTFYLSSSFHTLPIWPLRC
jgi:hypothetical protein